MLRWLVVGLLLANLLYWVWSQGWLGSPPGPVREPWRLQQQVRPEAVRVLPPGSPLPTAPAAPAASAASGVGGAASAADGSAALACFESAPLAANALDAAEQALAAVLPARGWIRASRELPAQHGVVLGPLARDALPKKREELSRLGLAAEELRLPAEAGAALALGRYDSVAAAQAALDGFAQKGLRTGRVAVLRQAGSETRLRIENASPAQAEALRSLKAPALGGLVACAAPPTAAR